MATVAPPPPAEAVLAHQRLGAFFVAAVTFVAYIGTLRFPFVFDDWLLIVGNPRVQSWRWVPGYFTAHLWAGDPSVPADYYRPFFLLWMRLNHAVFGLHPFGWHLTTILVHAGAAVLVYFLALRLTQRTWTAVFAGVIFGLHPLHVETAAWVCDSLDPIATIMFTGAFLCWLRYRRQGSVKALAASLALYAGSMLTKEPSIVLPAIIACYEWIWDSTESLSSRTWHALRSALVFAPLSVLYLCVRIAVLRGFTHPVDAPSFAQIVFTLPSVIFFYLKNLVWPARLSAFYDTGYVSKAEVHAFLLPLAGCLAFCAIAVYAVRRLPSAKPASFGLAWLGITLLPALYLPAFSASELVHDRYAYMASAGFCLLIASVLAQVKIRGTDLLENAVARTTAVSVLVLALVIPTVAQQAYWSSNLLLYARGTQIAPGNGLPALNLATELLKRGQYDKAYTILQNLIRTLPANPAVNYNLGILFYRVRDYARAEIYLGRAAKYDVNLPEAHVMLGIVQTRLGKAALGADEIRKAIELVPDGKGLHGALSEALEQQGDQVGALREAEIEMRLSPHDTALQDRVAKLRQETSASN